MYFSRRSKVVKRGRTRFVQLTAQLTRISHESSAATADPPAPTDGGPCEALYRLQVCRSALSIRLRFGGFAANAGKKYGLSHPPTYTGGVRCSVTSALVAAAMIACCLCVWTGDVVAQEITEKPPSHLPAFIAVGAVDDTAGKDLIVPSIRAAGRLEKTSSFGVDIDGNEFDPDWVLNTQFRFGLKADSGRSLGIIRLFAEFEHDVVAGPVWGGGDGQTADGIFAPSAVPNSTEYEDHTFRRANARLSIGPFLTLGGGIFTSHWGLGLLANDGAARSRSKTASFVDPRGGDVVIRALALTGPYTDHRLTFFAAYDIVHHDDVLVAGDEATQWVGGMSVGTMVPFQAGVYGVYRMQKARSGKETNVGVVDVFGLYNADFGRFGSLGVAAEAAIIFGETELGPTPVAPTHDVLQLGATLRASYDGGLGGAVLDVTYASGDQNFDDGKQNAFRADINHESGLLLYRYVLAAQTARFPITAADPELVGLPSEDLERLPTRGALTNGFTVFPRGWLRPADGLEIYGGPLLAWSDVPYADPLQTRLSGGKPMNPFGKSPSRFMGMEFDLGIRFTTQLFGTKLEVAAEGAVLAPGGALQMGGGTMDSIFGGRFLLSYEL
ncbi:MAG: hypothetical protein HUU55_16355 [Myxococcales bacterium]|nr:hypothetical protein [Myxococcales bacterium]